MSAVLVALIVAVFGFLGPMLLRRQEYRRQDELAEALAKTQRVRDDETHGQLEQIHTLVNSDKTAGLQREHDALIAQAALMNEVIELKLAAGSQPSASTITALDMTKFRIDELETELADRAKATKLGERQAKS